MSLLMLPGYRCWDWHYSQLCKGFVALWKHQILKNYKLRQIPVKTQQLLFEQLNTHLRICRHYSQWEKELKQIDLLTKVKPGVHRMCVCVCVCVCACTRTHCLVWFFVTPWTVAHQALLYMGLSRQEYWTGLLCPPLEDLPDPRIEPGSLASPSSAGMFFTSWVTRKAQKVPWKAQHSSKCRNIGDL